MPIEATVIKLTGRKFALGQLVSTPGALDALALNTDTSFNYLMRHASGDFGDLDKGDVALQNTALQAEKTNPDAAERMMSSYKLADGAVIWIITEWDRSVTTILLPEEY